MGEPERVTAAEIAALAARLRSLSQAGRAADEAEREQFIADKERLLGRIEAQTETRAGTTPSARPVDDLDAWRRVPPLDRGEWLDDRLDATDRGEQPESRMTMAERYVQAIARDDVEAAEFWRDGLVEHGWWDTASDTDCDADRAAYYGPCCGPADLSHDDRGDGDGDGWGAS